MCCFDCVQTTEIILHSNEEFCQAKKNFLLYALVETEPLWKKSSLQHFHVLLCHCFVLITGKYANIKHKTEKKSINELKNIFCFFLYYEYGCKEGFFWCSRLNLKLLGLGPSSETRAPKYYQIHSSCNIPCIHHSALSFRRSEPARNDIFTIK